MTAKRAGIAGCGAMGSLLAHRLCLAGIEVVIYDTSPVLVSAVESRGITVIDSAGNRSTCHPPVSSDPAILGSRDVVFIMVKTYDLTSCMESISRSVSAGTILVSVQNGIGNDLVIREFCPANPLVTGTSAMGATVLEPGLVLLGGTGDTVIGGDEGGYISPIAELLGKAGFPVKITGDVRTAVWRKAIVNAAINPLGAILGKPNGAIADDTYSASLQEDLVHEAVSVARGLGMMLDEDRMLEQTRTICRLTAANINSMLQDLRAGRRTEIDSINGAIARQGHSLGIPCPVNLTMVKLVHAMESPPRQES